MVRKVLRKYRSIRTLAVSLISAAVVVNFAAHEVWAVFPDMTAMQFYTYGINEANSPVSISVTTDIPEVDAAVLIDKAVIFMETPVKVLIGNQIARQYSADEYEAMLEDFAWTIMGENQNQLIRAFLDGDTDLFNRVVDSVAWVIMNRVKADEAHMGGDTIEGVLSRANSAGVPAFSCRWDKFGDPGQPGKFNIYHYRRHFVWADVDKVYDAISREMPEELRLSKKQISTRIEIIKLVRQRLENDIFSGRTQDPTYGAKFYISDAMLSEIDRGARPMPAHIMNLRQRGLPEILIPGTGHVFFADRPI